MGLVSMFHNTTYISFKKHNQRQGRYANGKLQTSVFEILKKMPYEDLFYFLSYRTRASNNRGFYYFFILLHVGFSLMFGGISLKSCGH